MEAMSYDEYEKFGWRYAAKPETASKFFTDILQHQKGKLLHNLKWGFPKNAAVDPEYLQDYIKQNGPYMYHGTNTRAVKHILNEGLYPQSRPPDEPGNHWDPRPGHVYLGSEKYVRGGYFLPDRPDSALLKIDLRKLNPSNFNADEDHWSARLEQDHPAIHRAWQTEAPPEDHWPTDDSLGNWAERTRIGDAPGETEYSMGQGSIAHEGPIPPEAISYVDTSNETPSPMRPIWAATDANHYEAKMYHGSGKGLLREIKTPFVTTDIPTDHPVSHPVSVTFRRPAHHFAPALTPEMIDMYSKVGHDGIVAHRPEGNTWAIALDPGTIIPGHDHEFPYT